MGVPTELLSRWQALAIVDQHRAVMAYQIVAGAWTEINPTTIAEVFAAGTPSLGAVGHYIGQDGLKQLVREMITAAGLLLNVGKNLRQEQVMPTVEFILRQPEYKLFTVADFRLAIDRGIAGKYGATYDRLDVTVICGWLNTYWSERMEQAEQMAIAAHSQHRKEQENEKDKPMPAWFSEWMQRRDRGKKVEREPEPFTPDPDILKFWREEYDRIPDHVRPTFEVFVKLKTAQAQKLKP